ncbi:MAG: energy-coupling factor ABC transporter permease [Clostridia bacterium]|nr:energy-coupling factor ABC transporter permease [Clostridia bacterium]
MIGVSGIGLSYADKKVNENFEIKKLSMFAMAGTFVFAAQMVNFTIPMTGSSGHMAGGLLLAILLGPYAGFITLSAILMIQALVFADGGILAMGCNIFNMAFIASFIVYPGIYLPLTKFFKKNMILPTILSGVLIMVMGAVAVVIETSFSGHLQLPFKEFFTLMVGIHSLIGLVEGIVTYLVISQLKKQIFTPEHFHFKKGLLLFAIVIVIMEMFVVNIASEQPDGLERSLERTGFVEKSDDTNFELMPDYASSQELVNDNTLSVIVGSSLLLLMTLSLGVMIKRKCIRNES